MPYTAKQSWHELRHVLYMTAGDWQRSSKSLPKPNREMSHMHRGWATHNGGVGQITRTYDKIK